MGFVLVHVEGPLYLSSRPRSERDVALLRREGIGAVVSLTEERPLPMPASIAHLHKGFPDGSHPSQTLLAEIYAFIDTHRRDTNVLVHCGAGVSRSAGIVVGQLLREHPGWTWERALHGLHAKHFVWVSLETRESVMAFVGARAGRRRSRAIGRRDAEALRLVERACAVELREVPSVACDMWGYAVTDGHVSELGLDGRGLAELPEAVCRLVALRRLRLRGNRLARVPAALGDLDGLEHLDLSDNRLTSLPDELGRLARLAELNLARNRFAALPRVVPHLAGLRSLYLHCNRLARLPDDLAEMGSLEEIYLHDNRLACLPASVGRLARLRRLGVIANPLARLPESLGGLVRLSALAASKCQLGTLPDALGRLPDLEYLDVSDCRLTALPPGLLALSRLRKLDLRGNPLDTLTAACERWLGELAARGCVVMRAGRRA